ncbi:MAG: UDP-N-acetylmuramoyl-tripeptide--D-alanyl-D-alanine ligase [Gallionella sp.]|nr:UDP-N-acetylmuramoyl-tripeptide--D-alanyl-D-alanine ligase [Gallionella sp.]MDD4946304.1 UDP-N-acetylmuramoyl-tripeptide--D-alanyl-D-alanine ligase [Gallionella sp.]MDD5612344.1 UDP-N-acetylmuramoyl-tripeptide--D-alanyl-D-alanine ligase [Gallionella sp.]
MMQLSQAAQVLHGRLAGVTGKVAFSGVSTDTRKLGAGDLYIALRGEKFDGANFVAQAAAAGAVAAVVNADSYHGEATPCPLLLVADTRIALGQLAAHWRKQFAIPLVAVTGSNGKTTVKEMLAAILRAAAGSAEAVLATRGNLNNDIGMPLTLLQLNAQHRYAVIEMGMNHPGEIDYLTMIARPEVALINNASGAHLEGMGSVEAVAHAKGEIFTGLQHDGSAIINADDDYAPLWRKLAGVNSLLEFGLNNHADVSGGWQPSVAGMRLDVRTPAGDFTADMQVPGEHNARNALAATAAAIALNVPLESIVAGLESFGGVPGRLQRKPARNGATVIDDTYNANPASMRAAIDVLAQASGKRVLVLGDMGELGENAAAFHAEMGVTARQAGIEKLYALGELSRQAVNKFGAGAQHFETLEALQAALEAELSATTTVLVKGSRFMKMERVVAYCANSEIKG